MAQGSPSQKTVSPKTSTDGGDPLSSDSPQWGKSSLQRQFSIVKKNAITLNALPQPLTQGKGNIAKGPRHSHSSKSSTVSRHKGEGEKKRRHSGNGKARGKIEGKGKHVRSGEQGDQAMTSWSPEHKRRAPETRLKDETEDKVDVDNKAVVDVSGRHVTAMSPKSESVSKVKQDKVNKNEEETSVRLRNKEERRISREDSMYESPTENLMFSFKEELLKRAAFKEELLKRATDTITTATGANEGDKVAVAKKNKLLVNGYEQGLSESLQEKSKTKRNDDSNNKSASSANDSSRERNLVTDIERKHSEDESVKSDSSKGSRSRKGSVLDEVELPVVPKNVQKLREKFLNINDMIEEKHKTNLAKKSHEIQRELKSVAAWKQQTDSHVNTPKKFSAGVVGKTAETRKPNIGTNRRSVKELRKMYMGDSENGSKEKLNLVRSRSMKATVSTERRSSAPETKEIPLQTSEHKPEKKLDSTEKETMEDMCNLAPPKDIDYVTEEGCKETYEVSPDTSDHMVVIHVDNGQDNNQEKMDNNVAVGNQTGESLRLSEQVGTHSLSHETRTYTIIKSGDVPNDIPSLEIQPASPEPTNGEQRSPGLKRHAASHDSGIDEPPYAQNNLLCSVPDEKISAASLKVAAEFSFPASESSVLTLKEQPTNETGSDVQSPDVPLSPGSDVSPEVFWSLPLSVGSRASLTDTSSSCSSPRMSVIIAQEASTTKINSRYFTVETMEPWDFEDHRIAEEHQCVMEVEGEFCFGREKSRTSKAERDAIFSLHRDARNRGLDSTDLIKEEEITLSPSEIDTELQALEAKHGVLERRGVEIEHCLRESMDCKYSVLKVLGN